MVYLLVNRTVSRLTRQTRLLDADVTEPFVLGLAQEEVGGLARTICGQCKLVTSAADTSSSALPVRSVFSARVD